MEVIDDCTLLFFGILPRTLRQTGTSSSPPQKNGRTEVFRVEFEYYAPVLELSIIGVRILVLKLNSRMVSVVLNSTHGNRVRSWTESSVEPPPSSLFPSVQKLAKAKGKQYVTLKL